MRPSPGLVTHPSKTGLSRRLSPLGVARTPWWPRQHWEQDPCGDTLFQTEHHVWLIHLCIREGCGSPLKWGRKR